MAKIWQLPTNREPTEHEEQRDFIRWFRQTFPGVLIYAIPNGGNRSKTEGAKFKLEGVVAGVFDLEVLDWDLRIEMKRQKTGSPTPEQKQFAAKLDRLGKPYFFAKGSVEAQRKTLEFLAKKKPQTGA